jgi:NarL family two-component system response regulator LiaR
MTQSQPPIRVLIVDDHAIVRKGTGALLSEIEGITVIGEASNGEEAIEQVSALQPDVILMDLMMPQMDGIEAIRVILSRQPQARILALTSFTSDDKIMAAIKAGAQGYFLKDGDPSDLVKAIRQIHRGEPALPPNIARRVMLSLSQSTPAPPVETLTERELEVLRLVAQGRSNTEIAAKLTVTEVTVRTHVSHILKKLNLSNRVQATLYALKEGLVKLENGAK